MATKAPVLQEKDLNYPKAMYKPAAAGEGDVKSPAYEKIVMKDGVPQRQVEFHAYITAVANDAKEEKELVKEGWSDHPQKMKAEAA